MFFSTMSVPCPFPGICTSYPAAGLWFPFTNSDVPGMPLIFPFPLTGREGSHVPSNHLMLSGVCLPPFYLTAIWCFSSTAQHLSYWDSSGVEQAGFVLSSLHTVPPADPISPVLGECHKMLPLEVPQERKPFQAVMAGHYG